MIDLTGLRGHREKRQPNLRKNCAGLRLTELVF